MTLNPRFLNRMPRGEQGIHKRTVRDRMTDKLSDVIQSSLLQPGDDSPPERELSETLKISREPVRATIAVPADRGLVEVSQGAGPRIVGTAGMTLVDSVRSMSALKTHHPQKRSTRPENMLKRRLCTRPQRASAKLTCDIFAAWSRCKSKC